MNAKKYKNRDEIFGNVYKHIPLWMRYEIITESKVGKKIRKKIEDSISLKFTARFIISYIEHVIEEHILNAEASRDFTFTPNAGLRRPRKHNR